MKDIFLTLICLLLLTNESYGSGAVYEYPLSRSTDTFKDEVIPENFFKRPRSSKAICDPDFHDRFQDEDDLYAALSNQVNKIKFNCKDHSYDLDGCINFAGLFEGKEIKIIPKEKCKPNIRKIRHPKNWFISIKDFCNNKDPFEEIRIKRCKEMGGVWKNEECNFYPIDFGETCYRSSDCLSDTCFKTVSKSNKGRCSKIIIESRYKTTEHNYNYLKLDEENAIDFPPDLDDYSVDDLINETKVSKKNIVSYYNAISPIRDELYEQKDFDYIISDDVEDKESCIKGNRKWKEYGKCTFPFEKEIAKKCIEIGGNWQTPYAFSLYANCDMNETSISENKKTSESESCTDYRNAKEIKKGKLEKWAKYISQKDDYIDKIQSLNEFRYTIYDDYIDYNYYYCSTSSAKFNCASVIFTKEQCTQLNGHWNPELYNLDKKGICEEHKDVKKIREKCQEKGGRWDIITSYSGSNSMKCWFHYEDAGNECKSNLDCIGFCIEDENNENKGICSSGTKSGNYDLYNKYEFFDTGYKCQSNYDCEVSIV